MYTHMHTNMYVSGYMAVVGNRISVSTFLFKNSYYVNLRENIIFVNFVLVR